MGDRNVTLHRDSPRTDRIPFATHDQSPSIFALLSNRLVWLDTRGELEHRSWNTRYLSRRAFQNNFFLPVATRLFEELEALSACVRA